MNTPPAEELPKEKVEAAAIVAFHALLCGQDRFTPARPGESYESATARLAFSYAKAFVAEARRYELS